MKNKVIVIALALIAAVMAACSPAASTPTSVPTLPLSPTSETTQEATSEAGQSELSGTAWTLTQINGSAPVSGTEITLSFTDTDLSGKACNTYSGSYTASGGKFTVSNVVSTLVACTQPKGVMDQETAYQDALRQAIAYKVSGDTLTIGTDTDPNTLMFAASTSASTTATPGTGSSGSTSSATATSGTTSSATAIP